MGYHTGSDIPNYWDYAKNFVLNDHMFESVESWSGPAHLYEVSAWSAHLQRAEGSDELQERVLPGRCTTAKHATPFAWTDITYLLHKEDVSWGFYLDHGAKSASNQGGVADYWNDAARLRRRAHRQATRQHPAAASIHRRARERTSCPRCPGSSPTPGTANTPRR